MNRMMKAWMAGCAVLAFAGVANAASYQLGVKGGVAVEKLGGDDVESDAVDSRTGFVGGAYFQADFSKSFGLRVESLYFMKGASADSSSFEATFKLDYIEFPVLAVAHVPMSEAARLDIFAGPTFAFNTKADLEGSVGGFSATVDVSDFFSSFDFGLTFGAGVSFDVGSVVLGFDGRYGIGLTTIAEEDSDTGFQPDVKTQGFAFMASVGLPVGAK